MALVWEMFKLSLLALATLYCFAVEGFENYKKDDSFKLETPAKTSGCEDMTVHVIIYKPFHIYIYIDII